MARAKKNTQHKQVVPMRHEVSRLIKEVEFLQSKIRNHEELKIEVLYLRSCLNCQQDLKEEEKLIRGSIKCDYEKGKSHSGNR